LPAIRRRKNTFQLFLSAYSHKYNKCLLFCKNFYSMSNMNTKEFAVIQTGGKQYKVSSGSLVSIEKIEGEHKKGDKLSFDKVLLVDDGKDATIGTPYIKGAKVDAEI